MDQRVTFREGGAATAGSGLGALLAALLHAPCCVAPPLLTILGLGSSVTGGWVEKLRIPALAVSAALTGLTFYFAYCRHPSRRNRLIAWVGAAATATAVGLALWRG